MQRLEVSVAVRLIYRSNGVNYMKYICIKYIYLYKYNIYLYKIYIKCNVWRLAVRYDSYVGR